MPRTAQATAPLLLDWTDGAAPAGFRLSADDCPLSAADRCFLLHLQRQALHYFLDNQQPCGLMLDRQHNHGPRLAHGLCSIAATGMGFISLALASAAPYRVLTRQAAARRVRAGLLGVLQRLPHDHGVLPHFVDSASGAVHGLDYYSTVETAWLVAGALWAAEFLGDAELEDLAQRLYDRIDFHYWTHPEGDDARGLLRHGKGWDGRFLDCSWDRFNGETAFMYVLAAGAEEDRAVTPASWDRLQPFHGTAAGLRFNNADLGLFVFQYGLDLLDFRSWQAPGKVDLWAEARIAALANERACRDAADTYATYRRFWGLSAGDGPGAEAATDVYRAYSPAGPIDGTAHVTATLASVAHQPEAVLRNLYEADRDPLLSARGRYGFSTINLDRNWVGRDMVGIDAGAAVLALDNFLAADRVRAGFHRLACVRRAVLRLGFLPRGGPSSDPAAPEPSMHLVS